MEDLLAFICSHSDKAPWILFILLLLTGLSVPISEDLLLITAGAIAATCLDPERRWNLFVWIYLGSWIAAWEAYWIGRLLGPKLYQIRWFKHFLTPKKIAVLHTYYEKFGVLVFIAGRFIPGGVRNTLFMSCGLGRMPFPKFVLRDSFACLISTTTLFRLGFAFGENYHDLVEYFKRYNLIFLSLAVLFLMGLAFWLWRRQQTPPG